MKKWLAILMVLLMSLSLCACSANVSDLLPNAEPDDVLTPETLEGDWVMKMDLSALLQSGELGDLSELTEGIDFSELDIDVALGVTFQDGKMTMNADDMVSLYQNVVDATLDWIVEGDNLYEMMAASDGSMTVEECKEYMEQLGMTKEVMLETIKAAMPDSDTLLEEIREDGSTEMGYELVDNKLYTWEWKDGAKSEDEYMLLSYADDVITVIKAVEDDIILEPKAGEVVFVRK